eukprot:scaffold220784_cov32-Tisochrysis_lutea.AAC.4
MKEPACRGAATDAVAKPQTPSATPCASPRGPCFCAPRNGLCTRPTSPRPSVRKASLPRGSRTSCRVSSSSFGGCDPLPRPWLSESPAQGSAVGTPSRRMRFTTESSEAVIRAPAPATPPTKPPMSCREPSTKCSA